MKYKQQSLVGSYDVIYFYKVVDFQVFFENISNMFYVLQFKWWKNFTTSLIISKSFQSVSLLFSLEWKYLK